MRVAALDYGQVRTGVAATDPTGTIVRPVGVVARVDEPEGFARLREVSDGIRAAHPDATWISAGMSGDLEAAIRHGATHLRVGSAILGARPVRG